MAPVKPTGNAASQPGGKPRAQVAYEGDDEFSTMSLDPTRRRKATVELEPLEPGVNAETYEKPAEAKGFFGLVRKLFSK